MAKMEKMDHKVGITEPIRNITIRYREELLRRNDVKIFFGDVTTQVAEWFSRRPKLCLLERQSALIAVLLIL